MTAADPPPKDAQRPVLLTVVRNITPVLATAITYALARSNIHLLRNPTVEAVINVVISAFAGLVWTAVFRWLEAHRSTWWGRAFLIADTPIESPSRTASKEPPTSRPTPA